MGRRIIRKNKTIRSINMEWTMCMWEAPVKGEHEDHIE